MAIEIDRSPHIDKSGVCMQLRQLKFIRGISKCIDKLLLTQTLSDENRWFCNVCNAKQDCTLFVEVKKVPVIRISR